MTRIAILTHTFSVGDAVGNDVFGMKEVLERRGHEVRIYAEGWMLEGPKVWPVSKIDRFLKSPNDLSIHHYSRGWDIGLDLLRDLSCKKVVKYHNITPPQFFEGISESHVQMCRAGRQQLKEIANSACDLFLADSAYNLQELIDEGVAQSRAVVVPPFHHTDRFYDLSPDFGVLDTYRDSRTNVLMVGRISPNKGHVALIEAFANYRRYHNTNSRLLIVGKEERSLGIYSALLREVIAVRRLQGAVIFTGAVSEAALKSYYLVAHVFATMSEHEGFCVPLVEAMAMKVPVVAYGSSAIPETMGGAGLVWGERDPLLFAESFNALAEDEATSIALARGGRQRYERLFHNGRIEMEFMKAVEGLL